jgi:hypothetical protein
MTPFVRASELYDPGDRSRTNVVDAARLRWQRDAERRGSA